MTVSRVNYFSKALFKQNISIVPNSNFKGRSRDTAEVIPAVP